MTFFPSFAKNFFFVFLFNKSLGNSVDLYLVDTFRTHTDTQTHRHTDTQTLRLSFSFGCIVNLQRLAKLYRKDCHLSTFLL